MWAGRGSNEGSDGDHLLGAHSWARRRNSKELLVVLASVVSGIVSPGKMCCPDSAPVNVALSGLKVALVHLSVKQD